MMGLMFFTKFSLLLFLLFSGSLLFSTSFAGGRSKFVSNNLEEEAVDVNEIQEVTKGGRKEIMDEEEVRSIHERVLRANTKDYGRYDPSPTLSKPPFKLIPN